MKQNKNELKKLICEIGRRCWTRGYVAANDGNISIRMDDETILATPTGVSKGFMTPDMIVTLDKEHNQRSPVKNWKVSSEIAMHYEAYRQRPDIKAVVHMHPPYATSFAVTGIELDHYIMTEAVVTLGPVGIAPFATPSTQEVPDSIKELIKRSDALLLANHGALTVGADLLSAYERMETLEHYAHILSLSFHLGTPVHFSDEQISKLLEMKQKMHVPGKIDMDRKPKGSQNNPFLENILKHQDK